MCVCVCHRDVELSYLVPGLRKEQVLPLVQPQYGSLEAMQFLQTQNKSGQSPFFFYAASPIA